MGPKRGRKGDQKGGRKGAKNSKKFGQGDDKSRITNLEEVLLTALRMLCSNTNELRQVARDLNLVLELDRTDGLLSQLLTEGIKNWHETRPDEGEHPLGALRRRHGR